MGIIGFVIVALVFFATSIVLMYKISKGHFLLYCPKCKLLLGSKLYCSKCGCKGQKQRRCNSGKILSCSRAYIPGGQKPYCQDCGCRLI